jgi:hypothetical protein
MEENKEIVQEEQVSVDPQELRKNKLIELNTEENQQLSKNYIKGSNNEDKGDDGKDRCFRIKT